MIYALRLQSQLEILLVDELLVVSIPFSDIWSPLLVAPSAFSRNEVQARS